MASYVQGYLPLITPRIEFQPRAMSPLPSITPRIEYTQDFIAYLESTRRSRDSEEEESDEEVDGQHPQTGGRDGRIPGQRQQPANTSTALPQARAGPSGSATAREEPPYPKPPGQPGRPGSGGYSLSNVLITKYGWSKTQVSNLNGAVRESAVKHLDTSICYREQNKVAIRKVCDELTRDDRWPDLRNYANCWPVRSVLQVSLKNRVQATKRATQKHVTTRVLQAMRGATPGDDDAEE